MLHFLLNTHRQWFQGDDYTLIGQLPVVKGLCVGNTDAVCRELLHELLIDAFVALPGCGPILGNGLYIGFGNDGLGQILHTDLALKQAAGDQQPKQHQSPKGILHFLADTPFEKLPQDNDCGN